MTKRKKIQFSNEKIKKKYIILKKHGILDDYSLVKKTFSF
jgi:hypothetical protein